MQEANAVHSSARKLQGLSDLERPKGCGCLMKQLLVMSVRFVYSLVPFRCGERPLTVTNGQTCSLARRISEPERRRKKEKKPYLASNFPLHLAGSLLLGIRLVTLVLSTCQTLTLQGAVTKCYMEISEFHYRPTQEKAYSVSSPFVFRILPRLAAAIIRINRM